MKKTLLAITCLLALTFSLRAQTDVSGRITGDDGEPLPGVTILEKGTSNGAVTDVDGNYRITVASNATLVVSYVGFKSQEVSVGSRSVVDITLQYDVEALDEVVVTAFGLEQEQKALGYSVTEVDGDQFTKSRAINLGAALTGKVAGVNVSTPASGAAGSSRVVIRGGSSLSGNDQPLYVVNGMPIDNTNLGAAGLWGGNDGGDGLSSINPDDIENISVLKGNTAAALYGARAANGVILITTKSGKAQQGIGISYNSNFTVDRVNDLTEWQNQYGHGQNGQKPTNQASALENGQNSWGARLDGTNVVQFDGVERPYSDTGEGLNDFYRTGYTWTNTLALSGGGESMTYRFSASELNNEDIVPNSGFDRRLLSANLSGNHGPLTTRVSIQYSNEKAKNRPRLSDSPGNANFTALLKSPAISFESLKGDPNKLGANADGTELQHQGNVFAQNPYWAAYQWRRFDDKDRILGNASLRYDITDWLYVQGRIGTDLVSVTSESTTGYGTAFKPRGDFNLTTRKLRENNVDVLIGANRAFDNFEIDILLGGNRMRRSDESTRIGGDDFNIPFFSSVTNIANQTYTYNFSEFGINSIFGQANFSYNGYLFLNFTGRQDNFSTLAEGSNSIFYPSVGLSVVVSDMMSLPSAVTFGKIRASWAQVGGGAPDPYQLAQTYSLLGEQHNGATLGRITNGSIPNAGLQPYTSQEFEIGLDLRLFDNRVGIDVGYYSRKTTDDILQTSISSTSGFGTTLINIGELTNQGIELLINATPVRTGAFSWDVSFNMANNISEVISLGENAQGEPIEFLNLDAARTLQESIRHYVGQPLGIIAGYRHRQINGQPVYDANGFPVRSEQFEILGEGRHPFSAGLRNSVRYKDFDLSILIDMRSGGSVMSGTNLLAYGFGLHEETVVGRESGLTVTGVDEAGESLTVNIAPEDVDDYYGRYNDITNNFVYDASFGKLRELSLGYTIPRSALANLPIETASLSFVGRNLLLLWSDVPNIDPESSYASGSRTQGLEFFALPATRNVGFNLSVTF
ncbi:MAG: SusC/RagA family TonB-linked outer membrane protein [Cytophagales bacterium]|nr:SusC/RagA family TonB-linked outer membrane protein [Cytophagales bacterium]